MEMLSILKTNLRLDTDIFDDDELQVLISACSKDLINAGVSATKAVDYEDALIQRAVILYAKANFGYEDNAERFERAYTAQKNSLALAGDYT
jgi:uncharacterized phage protein (predicted DNA packaging)